MLHNSVDLTYTIPKDGMVTFESSKHQYALKPFGRGCFTIRLNHPDDGTLHSDTINLDRASARDDFTKRLNGRADVVARELLAISGILDEIFLPHVNAGEPDTKNPYRIDERGITHTRVVDGKEVDYLVANFGAEIIADVEIDDGAETRREFRIRAWQGGLRRTFDIATDRYHSARWWVDVLGAKAVVFPGQNSTQHVLIALQLDSKAERSSVFGHVGWRKLDDDSWGYLTTGGAITASGLRTDIGVYLQSPLDSYLLPDPPTGEALASTVRELLAIVEIASDLATFPLFCAITRAPFGPADFVLYLKGETGVGKTQLAAVFQQCFGSSFSPDRLPANFTSTANAIEAMTNLVHDAVIVVDDFQRGAGANADAIAERVGRAAGNGSGRGRMTHDTKIRKMRPPMGTIIMTGEDAPVNKSLRARLSIIDFQRNAMRWDRLTQAQKLAGDGVYSAAMSGFLAWLAADYPRYKDEFQAAFQEMRSYFRNQIGSSHPRSATTAAHLLTAFDIWLVFSQEIGAITAPEADVLRERARLALIAMVNSQSTHLAEVDPVDQFMRGLESAVVAGDANFADLRGEAPESPLNWGWLKVPTSEGTDYRPRGKTLGWVARAGVYLDFGAAYALVQRSAASSGFPLPLTEATMLQRLVERNLVLSREQTRNTPKIRKRIQGQTRSVVHLAFRIDDTLSSHTPINSADTNDTNDIDLLDEGFSRDSFERFGTE